MRRNYTRMGRQRFKDTLRYLGASEAVRENISAKQFEDLVDDPEKEVVRHSGHIHDNHRLAKQGAPLKRKATFHTISREEWIDTQTALRAAHRVRQLVSERTNSSLIKVGIAREASEHPTNSVIVAYDTMSEVVDQHNVSFQELEGILPSRVEGTVRDRGTLRKKTIPVITNERKLTLATGRSKNSGDYFNAKYRPVPGGVSN